MTDWDNVYLDQLDVPCLIPKSFAPTVEALRAEMSWEPADKVSVRASTCKCQRIQNTPVLIISVKADCPECHGTGFVFLTKSPNQTT